MFSTSYLYGARQTNKAELVCKGKSSTFASPVWNVKPCRAKYEPCGYPGIRYRCTEPTVLHDCFLIRNQLSDELLVSDGHHVFDENSHHRLLAIICGYVILRAVSETQEIRKVNGQIMGGRTTD